MSILIIYGNCGAGKTVLLSHLANQFAFDGDRNRAMQEEIQTLNANGFNLTVPEHCVATGGYDLTCKKWRYYPRQSRRINPYRLGFANPYVETHFSVPYEVYAITEAQKYLNSRMSMFFPDWQSRWYEGHRHNHLEIMLDCQRPELIDVNVRTLATFWEICDLKIGYDYFGKVNHLEWYVKEIKDSKSYDKYVLSAGRDSDLYTEKIISANYNVFDLYDSYALKPKFFDGHMNTFDDFDLDYGGVVEENFDSYVEYLKKFNDELPDKFYKRK